MGHERPQGRDGSNGLKGKGGDARAERLPSCAMEKGVAMMLHWGRRAGAISARNSQAGPAASESVVFWFGRYEGAQEKGPEKDGGGKK